MVASTTMDGRPMTFAKMLDETNTDGIAVLHRGKLIYERYFGVLKPHKPHIVVSVMKSFTGTLAGILSRTARLIRRRRSQIVCRSLRRVRSAMRACTSRATTVRQTARSVECITAVIG